MIILSSSLCFYNPFIIPMDAFKLEMREEEKERGRGREREGKRERGDCLLYTSPSPRDKRQSRMPSSA